MNWMPDQVGLDSISLELVVKHGALAHLRLADVDRYPVAACAVNDRRAEARTWGQLWTGVPDEVTCPACLELVHA